MLDDAHKYQLTGFEFVLYTKLVWSIWSRGSEKLFCTKKFRKQLMLLVAEELKMNFFLSLNFQENRAIFNLRLYKSQSSFHP